MPQEMAKPLHVKVLDASSCHNGVASPFTPLPWSTVCTFLEVCTGLPSRTPILCFFLEVFPAIPQERTTG